MKAAQFAVLCRRFSVAATQLNNSQFGKTKLTVCPSGLSLMKTWDGFEIIGEE